MTMDSGSAADHHIAGLYTHMLMDPLVAKLSNDAINDLLLRAGEVRSLEEITNVSSWSSHEQFKRLLQVTKATVSSIARPGENGLASMMAGNSELGETTQAFGSPGSVLASGTEMNPLVPIRRYDTNEVGPTEWTIREWFVEGFAPYPEFCEFVMGQYTIDPDVLRPPAGRGHRREVPVPW